jgi:hypothetical protein
VAIAAVTAGAAASAAGIAGDSEGASSTAL